MGAIYYLVNRSKRQVVRYRHIAASSKREMAGQIPAAAITTWYLLENSGDEIAFIADDGRWPFSSGSVDEVDGYEEMTDAVVDALIAAEILSDHGREVYDEDDPEVYCRILRNVWDTGP